LSPRQAAAVICESGRIAEVWMGQAEVPIVLALAALLLLALLLSSRV
jgi:hypothetical protein